MVIAHWRAVLRLLEGRRTAYLAVAIHEERPIGEPLWSVRVGLDLQGQRHRVAALEVEDEDVEDGLESPGVNVLRFRKASLDPSGDQVGAEPPPLS